MDTRPVVLDDQLGLLAALGVLALPGEVAGVPLTTYAWQQRILGAFVNPRSTSGQLHVIANSVSVEPGHVLDAAARPRPERLEIVDPRPLALEVARLRVAGMNQIAAETIATAKHHGAVVRVAAGNGQGTLAQRIAEAGIDFAVWGIVPR